MKNGKLYGVGVGPGDPELLTLKAVRIINSCPIIGVPGKSVESSTAYNIVLSEIDLTQKEVFLVDSPMVSDSATLLAAHQHSGQKVISYLSKGKDVAVLTLGDPTVYSTYIYLQRYVSDLGFDAEIISGVPSFCAAAAKSCDSLVDQNEQLHIIPACYGIADTASLSGTKVYMKAGSLFPQIRETFSDRNGFFIENCGMENEQIYRDISALPNKGSYFSLGIIKE